MASTPPGALRDTTATMMSVAGRLLTRLASTALTAATASRAGRLEPDGIRESTTDERPWFPAAVTTTPRARTKIRNVGSAALTRSLTESGGRLRVRATAAAVAHHTGGTPAIA